MNNFVFVCLHLQSVMWFLVLIVCGILLSVVQQISVGYLEHLMLVVNSVWNSLRHVACCISA
jgi:hypothetical protein